VNVKRPVDDDEHGGHGSIIQWFLSDQYSTRM
jgi:hypothetical protein